MGRSCSFLLLLLLLPPGPGAAFSLLRYRYDCGDYGMQLLAYPTRGRTVRFKVMDEFGTRFDVANCSICLHWLNAGADGAIVFSSGYEGCHVLVKEDRYVLRVQLEEMLLSGAVAASYEVNMTCPQPGDYEVLTGGNTHIEHRAGRGNSVHQTQADVLVPLSQPGLLHHVSQSALTLPGPQVSPQAHSEQVHPVARTQPVLVHPGLQPQPQPSLVRPGLQPQPGQARPGLQPQPGMVHPITQPQRGLIRPGMQPQNQPGLLHPGAQPQPGLLRPGLQPQNQPGLGLCPKTSLGWCTLDLRPNQGFFGQGLCPKTSLGWCTRDLKPNRVFFGQGLCPKTSLGWCTPDLRPNRVFAQGLCPKTSLGWCTPDLRPNWGFGQGLCPKTSLGWCTPDLRPNRGFAQGLCPKTRLGWCTPVSSLLAPAFRPTPTVVSSALGSRAKLGCLTPAPSTSPSRAWCARLCKAKPGWYIPAIPDRVQRARDSSPDRVWYALGFRLSPSRVWCAQDCSPKPSRVCCVLGFSPRPACCNPRLSSTPRQGQVSRRGGREGCSQGWVLPVPGAADPSREGTLGRAGQGAQGSVSPPPATPGTQLTREQCQVAVGRMACVAPQGREACLQAGCCYDDMDRVAPCYYGNTATVQCLLDGHFVLVVPRGLATQPYNLDSVRLASTQAGCEPVRVTETFVMFRFPVTQCGTAVQAIEDRLIYENQLISTIDVQGSPRGSITRDSIYILQARCIYNASDLLPLRMEVAVPPTAAPLAMPGPLGLQLRIATDESYSSYHPDSDYPLVRVLRDPIYVEVRLLQKTDPNLVLVLHHCWASPSTEATAEPQWPILVDGCPFAGDNYRTQLVPVGPASPELPFPSHYQRFVVSTFTFVEPPAMAVLEGEVYISCSASVCHLAQPEPCRPSCQLGVPSRARRALGDRRRAEAASTVTSQGRVVFPKVPKLQRG
ncbi:hypothetical protein QYF61_019990 [Mycteria americana]|uniref:ZP1 protein n=1 Tax=Mycteria americana TaxID=33587 RepID=A0AAN7RW45_MYCAM|nr:hypothetical protein QYF61_019990 [Mycteria americana]